MTSPLDPRRGVKCAIRPKGVRAAMMRSFEIGLNWLPRTLAAVAVSAATLAAAFSASAQTNQQVEWCNGEDNATPELSISGCTAMIQSGAYAGEELAIILDNRGIAYFKDGQLESAIQDYDQAIRLRPNFLSALISRGFAYLKMKNYGSAIAAFDAALEAYPENAPALYGRALAQRADGDAVEANAEIAEARRLDPAIAQELAALGVTPEASPELAALSPSAGPASAPADGQNATPQPARETASLPSAAAAVTAGAPPMEQTAAPPAPAPGGQSATPRPAGETASLPSAATAAGAAGAPPMKQTAAPPAPQPAPAPAPAPAPEIASLPLPADVTEALIERGDELLRTGDIVAARLAYERAAAGGNRNAETGVAKTYDPLFLAQRGVRGLRGDPARAALWYGRAAAAGEREAQERLKRLRAQFPQ